MVEDCWPQVFGTRVLYAWNCRWEDRCFFLWCAAPWTSHWSPTCGCSETEPCCMGVFVSSPEPWCTYNGLFGSDHVCLNVPPADDAYGIKCSQAKQYLETENVKALADTRLQENYDANQMQRAVLVAALCVRQSAVWRPSMSQVLAYITLFHQ